MEQQLLSIKQFLETHGVIRMQIVFKAIYHVCNFQKYDFQNYFSFVVLTEMYMYMYVFSYYVHVRIYILLYQF